jgi:hypothetical protein
VYFVSLDISGLEDKGGSDLEVPKFTEKKITINVNSVDKRQSRKTKIFTQLVLYYIQMS